MAANLIVYADKTVLRIRGVQVRGLRPAELEDALSERLATVVRVIGATGTSLDMDVYGLGPEAILTDAAGMVRAVSAVPGIRAEDVVTMESGKRIVEVDAAELPDTAWTGCAGERWRQAQ